MDSAFVATRARVELVYVRAAHGNVGGATRMRTRTVWLDNSP